MRLSYSKISSYTTCPRKYFFESVVGIQTEPNKYLTIGKRIHEIMYNAVLETDWKKYLQEVKEYQDPEYKPMIDNFIIFQDNVIKAGGNPKPQVAEVKYYDADMDFSLVIDRIDKHENRKLLCDYKSDGTVSNKHEKQLLIYCFFYNKFHPEDPITHYGPLFIKKQTMIKAKPVTAEKINEAMNWVMENKKEMETKGKDVKEYNEKPGYLCKYCSFAKKGYCEAGYTYMNNKAETDEMIEGDFA